MNYITILDFMVDDLKLKGNELIVFAIIYGFSQDGIHEFNGSYEYMKKWLSTKSNDTINNIYKKLVEKELIVKRNYKDENNNKRVSYVVSNTVHRKSVDVCTDLKSHSTPKIGDNNKTNIKDIYKEIIEKYTEDEELRSSLIDFVENRKQMKKPVTVLALQKNLNKLSSLTSSNNIKRLIVNTSIEYGWSSFYPLREQSVQSTKVDKSSYDVQFDESGRVIYE